MLGLISLVTAIIVVVAVAYNYTLIFKSEKKAADDLKILEDKVKKSDAKVAKMSKDELKKLELQTRVEATTQKKQTDGKLAALGNDVTKRVSAVDTRIVQVNSDLKLTSTKFDKSLSKLTTDLNTTIDKYYQTMSQQVATDVSTKNLTSGGTTLNGTTTVNGGIRLNGSIQMQANEPGVMIEKRYGNKANDRYGVGQYKEGSVRMYTADSAAFNNGTVNLSVAKGENTFDDIVTVRANDRRTKVRGDLDVDGTLWFGKDDGSTDPYSLRKVRNGVNNSSLRLSLGDDDDEALEIWGRSGEGSLQHKFGVNGDAHHKGTLNANRICLGDVCVDSNKLKKLL